MMRILLVLQVFGQKQSRRIIFIFLFRRIKTFDFPGEEKKSEYHQSLYISLNKALVSLMVVEEKSG